MRILFFAFATLLLISCAGTEAQLRYPDAEWTYVSPDTLDADKLNALDAVVRSGQTYAMLAVKNGEVIYAYGDVAEVEPTYIASVRKSILSMMFGQLAARGGVDFDATLEDLGVDDLGGLSQEEKSASLREIISARSGIYHPASNSSGIDEADPKRFSKKPGTYFWYNNWDFNAAGGVFEMLAGQDIYGVFSERLARPLGLQDFDLERHRRDGREQDSETSVSKYPPYYFFLSARDMARLGLLMLREGIWSGEEIIPAEWISESTSLVTPNAEMNPEVLRNSEFGFGYMWWVFDPAKVPDMYEGGYAARGHYGQYIVVLPKLDLVIAHKTLPKPSETPEEYEAINVSWDEMRELVALSVDLAACIEPVRNCPSDDR
jgi:CubicO group peptidase (beta-lactamase class C family)